jgi:hypothetical protein
VKRVPIVALVFLVVSCSDPTTGPAPADQVEIVSGNGQLGAPGFVLEEQLEIRLVDADGAPLAGAAIQWDTEDRDALLAPAISTTNSDGIATTSWRLGRDEGTQSVNAIHGNLTAARFEAVARSGEVSHAGGPLAHQCGKFTDEVVRCWTTPADGPAVAVALETDLRFVSLGFAVDRWCGSARGGAIACVLDSELSPGGVFRPDAAPVHVVAQGVPEFARLVGAGDAELGLTWCGQALDQSVWCWGRNDAGQLGNGILGVSSDVPVPVVGGLRVISVAVTAGAACAIDVQGVAWCWGASEQGVVHHDGPSAVPVVVPTPRRFFQVAADGSGSVCAIDGQQLMYCWGSNLNGGRGRDGVGVSSTPTTIEGTDFFVSVTGGDDGFLGLTVDRTLVVWGGLTGTSFVASPARVLPTHVFGEILPGGGNGVVCLRAYPDGARCIDRVGLARALSATPAAHLIYGVPGQ